MWKIKYKKIENLTVLDTSMNLLNFYIDGDNVFLIFLLCILWGFLIDVCPYVSHLSKTSKNRRDYDCENGELCFF